MCNIIFVCAWIGLQAHIFAMYYSDTYSEYITPCMVMNYATSDAIWVTPPRLRTLRSRAMVGSDWVYNTMNGSQEEIG
jgi:hypothetical protein